MYPSELDRDRGLQSINVHVTCWLLMFTPSLFTLRSLISQAWATGNPTKLLTTRIDFETDSIPESEF